MTKNKKYNINYKQKEKTANKNFMKSFPMKRNTMLKTVFIIMNRRNNAKDAEKDFH